MKCYNILFTSKGLLNNIGSYTFLSIIFLNIILVVAFISKGYKTLFAKIYEIKKGSNSYKNKEIMNNNDIIKTTGNSNIKKGKKKNKKANKRIIKKTNKKKKKNKKNNSEVKEPPKKYKNRNKTANNDDSKAIKLSSSEVKVQLKISKKIINCKDTSHNNMSILNSKIQKLRKVRSIIKILYIITIMKLIH